MAEEAELVETLLQVASGAAPWSGFLERLGRGISADGLGLQAGFADGGGQLWHWGRAWPLPEPAVAGRMRLERVYSQVDIPGGAAGPLRALRVALPGGGQAVLLAMRRIGDFRAVDAARLSGVARYLALALAGWRRLEEERAAAALDRQGAEALGLGWLVLSSGGRVMAVSDLARTDLAPRAGLRLRADGRMGYDDSETEQAFGMAMAAALASDEPVALPPRDGALRIMLRCGIHLGARAVTVSFRWQRPLRDLPPESLARSLGLRPSEARLAARIADGLTLEAAAADLGWTIETTRSTSKQLFARLGVAGQTGVMRELLQRPGFC